MKKFFVVTMMAALLGTVSFGASAQEKKAEQDKGFWFDVSASAGGMTSTSVWGGSAPYLHSVPSFDDNVKKNGHGVGMSQHGANNLAKQGYNAYQILQYFYQNVKFAKLNNSL